MTITDLAVVLRPDRLGVERFRRLLVTREYLLSDGGEPPPHGRISERIAYSKTSQRWPDRAHKYFLGRANRTLNDEAFD